MSEAKELINEILSSEFSDSELTSDGIIKSFSDVFSKFGIDDVQVDSVDIDAEGDIEVIFSDEEGDELSVTFLVDDEGDEIVAIINDEDPDEDEVLTVDLTPLGASILRIPGVADYVNLTDLPAWMNKSTLITILQAGEIGIDATSPEKKPPQLKRKDAQGNQLSQDIGSFALEAFQEDYEDLEVTEAGTTKVVRGGKVVKLPLVRRRRRRVLSGKQKAAIRKAALKRKAKKGQISRKRKRSLKIRKQRGLKKRTKNTSRFKVRGGANRSR